VGTGGDTTVPIILRSFCLTNSWINSSLVLGLWYNLSQWPFSISDVLDSSMVQSLTKPFSYTVSTSYGPSHRVWILPLKSLYCESNRRAQSSSLNFFSLMKLSCHLSLCCWNKAVWCIAAWKISPSSLIFLSLCYWASEISKPTCSAILSVLISNLMGRTIRFTYTSS